MIKVCHVTNVHSSDDARIFHKECTSLAKNGYDVTLVTPGESREQNGVHVIGCGEKPTSRIKRATTFASRIINTALAQNCEIYHLHDPELLLYAMRLKRKGKIVIFDSHEDYFFEKEYLPLLIRKLVSIAYLKYESHVISNIDGLVCCYRKTRERLEKKCKVCEMIYNFPIIKNEFAHEDTTQFIIGYAGGIGKIWSHENIIKAIADMNGVSYRIAGRCYDDYLEVIKGTHGWDKVEYLGVIPFKIVQEKIYAQAALGVALLDYIPECNGKEGNLSNTKLFEIMHAGLPVLATDFILWKEIIDKYNCGICVNPNDINAIKNAIKFFVEHPIERKEMGLNARRAIECEYNWSREEEKLLKLYRQLK